ncbi:disease resistance RPP13-like protein 4 [Cannabis sativa]|uniref:AAA+ ATPase domain-containing protein n=2 Tax=Cannabis sativa TaxID=3483 RepID=A0A7J6FPJ7_CANSA|nr:disease resistance RPP13-like protein 4 [Cannabis sativa]KAF4372641.1 hypothetical protein F8388_027314 [Cannabis sativa]KAF4379206.1 hypothetical protein G4B88_010600 [Cannabis sativa]
MEVVIALIPVLTEELIKAARTESEFGSQLIQLENKLKQATELLDEKKSLKQEKGIVKETLIQLKGQVFDANDILTDCLMKKEPTQSCCFSFVRGNDPFFSLQESKKLKEINSHIQQHINTLGQYSGHLEKSRKSGCNDEEDYDPQQALSLKDKPAGIIGLEEDTRKLKNWIVNPTKPGFQIIAVVGMGGLGKTTLVQKVFDEIPKECSVIWLNVTRNFNKHRILKLMLKKLPDRIPSKLDSCNLMEELREALRKDDKVNYLIVMDDVWSMDNSWWHDLKSIFTFEDKNITIVITSRDREVVDSIGVEKDLIHQPNPLNNEDSWSLFTAWAFTDKGSNSSAKSSKVLEEIGKKIAEKCGGLPLSIKTIGSLLSTKTRVKTWTEVLEKFHKSPIKGNDEVIQSLRWSYSELDPHLQQCLLCLSIYPEDYVISAEQLIHWWVGEGFLQKKAMEDKKTVLELGYECLSKLASRCLIEVVDRRSYDDKVYSCKIHDMVRELLITIADEEEGFCSFNEKGIIQWRPDLYWLGLTDEMELTSFGANSKLRALFLTGSRRIDFSRNSGQLLSLRVLDLSAGCSSIDEKNVKNLLDWISTLKRLACLNLSELKGLIQLPSSICELLNLKLLVLNECTKLKRLSPSIANLRRLMVLHMGGCPLEYIPEGLKMLSELQELTGFRVVGQTKPKVCGLLELKILTQLRMLHIVLSNDEIQISNNDLKDILPQLKNLKVLDIDADQCRDDKVFKKINFLCPPESLRELYLRSFHRARLPNWVHPSTLKELQYLCIEDADITDFIPKFENDQCSAYKWGVLEGLCLKELKMLKLDWEDVKKAMPALKHWEVPRRYQITNYPDDVDQKVSAIPS